MPVLPHNFPTLRGAVSASLLAIGAGVSHGLVPLPNRLLAERRAGAEEALGLGTSLPWESSPSPADLYKWADEVVARLVERGDPNPKLTLAESLGIPSEPQWRGAASTLESLPRHRVIARFARERFWEQIWSFNWDCLQENALENVGIKRNAEPTDAQAPWFTVFHTFVTAADCGQMAAQNVVKVVKPHGCVYALVDAQVAQRSGDAQKARQLADRFLITESELVEAKTSGTDKFVFSTFCNKLAAHPFVIVGWSASEEYLLRYVENDVKPVLDGQALALDRLSIVDLKFNNNGHARLAACYGRDESTTFLKVETSLFTTDELFLWVQALYALGCLAQWAPTGDRSEIEKVSEVLLQPPDVPHFVVEWADVFLPTWVRLCWRCELVTAHVGGQPVSPETVSLESRDEHVPWQIPNINRPDLRGAARMLAALLRKPNEWSFRKYPGALYRDNLLVIPLPAWAPLPNSLRGLTRLLKAIAQAGVGYVEAIKILPVAAEADAALDGETIRQLITLVAAEVPTISVSGNIASITFEDLNNV